MRCANTVASSVSSVSHRRQRDHGVASVLTSSVLLLACGVDLTQLKEEERDTSPLSPTVGESDAAPDAGGPDAGSDAAPDTGTTPPEELSFRLPEGLQQLPARLPRARRAHRAAQWSPYHQFFRAESAGELGGARTVPSQP